jgi:hypothetical protein
MKGCRRITPILAFAITSAAWGQSSAPPPPAQNAPPPAQNAPPSAQNAPTLSAESAQQLAAAMQVIQKELNSVGKITFKVDVSNADEKGSSQLSEQASNVIADPATCTIRYHWWESIAGNVVDDEDMSISLHDVQGVSTMSAEESWKKEAEAEGATPDQLKIYYEKFDPPMFIVAMKTTGDNGESFSFTDQKQASRVGEAVTQAVKLCGGKPDPF